MHIVTTNRAAMIAMGVVALVALTLGLVRVWNRPVAVVSVIDLHGEMDDSTEIVKALEAAGKSRQVRAIVLRVNSPGGNVAVAQDVFVAVKQVRALGKPVVAAIGSVGASGGYYASLAAQEIWAQPGSLTGSIGVIYDRLDVSGLAAKLGVSREALTAGAYKDAGSPWRQPTAAESAMMRGVLDDIYKQFLDAVRGERGLDEAAALAAADGRVWTGRQALALHLVDRLGSWREAARRAAEIAHLSPDTPIKESDNESWWWKAIIGTSAEAAAAQGRWWTLSIPRWQWGGVR